MTATEETDRKDIGTKEQVRDSVPDLKSALEGLERDLILKALKESHGNKTRAARALGITERVMGIRVKQLDIDWRGMRVRRRLPTECVCERCGGQIQQSPAAENLQGDGNHRE